MREEEIKVAQGHKQVKERKEQHKAARIILYIARWAGIASFVGGLLIFPYAFCDSLLSSGEMDEYHITHLFMLVLSSIMYFYGPLVVVSLILSLITLDIEQDKRFRLRPLKLVMAGIGLYVLHLFMFFMIFFHREHP